MKLQSIELSLPQYLMFLISYCVQMWSDFHKRAGKIWGQHEIFDMVKCLYYSLRIGRVSWLRLCMNIEQWTMNMVSWSVLLGWNETYIIWFISAIIYIWTRWDPTINSCSQGSTRIRIRPSRGKNGSRSNPLETTWIRIVPYFALAKFTFYYFFLI